MNPPIPVVTGVSGSPAECAVPACAAPVTTALLPHWRPGMAMHRHESVEDARACEAEHADLMARLAAVRWAS